MNAYKILALISLFPSLTQACEGCKMSSVNAAKGGIVETRTVMAGFAFSWSVLFMLVTVFILLGVLFWAIRSACIEAEEAHRVHGSTYRTVSTRRGSTARRWRWSNPDRRRRWTNHGRTWLVACLGVARSMVFKAIRV